MAIYVRTNPTATRNDEQRTEPVYGGRSAEASFTERFKNSMQSERVKPGWWARNSFRETEGKHVEDGKHVRLVEIECRNCFYMRIFQVINRRMIFCGFCSELVSEAVGQSAAAVTGEEQGSQAGEEALKNNYVRPEGQNVGNFVTDRPSSRVLAPPGGHSCVQFH